MQFLYRFLVIVAAGVLPSSLLAAAPANPSLNALIGGIDDGTEQPDLILSELTVSIDQHGAMAEVQIDARITNPTDEEIEARFTMQLPRAAILTGYSLDIGGVMIPGSLIDQPKAQQIYEDEVRGNIDPGLAEITSTNEFSTRIYPISGEGSRRISLTFVTPVDVAAGLSIPLESVGRVGVFRINASVTGVASPPALSLTGGPSAQFARNGRAWTLSDYTLGEVQLSGSLQLSGIAPQSDAMATRHSNGRTFFAITDQLVGSDLSDDPPDHVRVYWDVSRSRADALVTEERALLGRFLREIDPRQVDVVSFASAQPQLRSFSAGEVAALDTHLAASIYRGATSFAGLHEVAGGEADLCILFSDGDTSLDLTENFEPDCPLIVITSGPNTNAQNIGLIIDDNGAKALFLNAQNSAEILAQMRQLPVGVISIRDRGGNRLNYRALSAEDGQFSVVGEMGEWDEITVRLSGARSADRRRTYQVDTARAGRNDAAGALWAAGEVTRLSSNPADRESMQSLAQQFQVASPTMAFLVLETPEQYLTADIEPPRGFDEDWRSAYRTAKAQHDLNRKSERDDRLEFVVAEWEATRRWWNAQYDQDSVMRRHETASSGQNAQESDGQYAEASGETAERLALPLPAVASPPAPPPPPPPPPPPVAVAPSAPQEAASAESYAGGSDEMIVVTAARRTSALQDVPVAVSALSAFEAPDQSGGRTGAAVQVALAEVLSDRPYLEALDQAEPAERMQVLAEQEEAYGSVPGFYFDVAEWFRLNGEAALGRELLLSALDLKSSDDETLLIVAFRLERDGDYDTAIELLEALNARIDYRSQPGRILALALMARAEARTGAQSNAARLNDLERAFALLRKTVLDPADNRYAGLETVALMELNSLIPLIEEAGGSWSLDERLIGALDTDIRVVVEWTSADADLDLWVREPSGEEAYYGNQRTALGGKISNDMTDGYGPEEYVLRAAYAGDYQVRVQGFSGDRINPNGPGRAMVRLIRNFARQGQSQQLIDAEVGFDRSIQDENDRVVATISVNE